MKKQNLIGIGLFIIGCLLIVGLTEYSHTSSAAYFGKTVAQAAIFSLLICLVLLATPYRKTIAIGIIVGSTWLASSIYSSVELYKSVVLSRGVVKEAVELIDNFNRNNKISQSTDVGGEQLTFIQLVQNYMANTQRINEAYAAELEGADLASILAPENLVNEKSLKTSQSKLSSLLLNIPKYEKKLLEELLVFEDTLSSRKDRDSIDALKGFKETKEDGILLHKVYFKTQENIISTVNKIVVQAQGLQGKLAVENGLLLFPSQDELDIYNNSLNEIKKLSQDEQKILEYRQGKLKVSTDELKKLL